MRNVVQTSLWNPQSGLNWCHHKMEEVNFAQICSLSWVNIRLLLFFVFKKTGLQSKLTKSSMLLETVSCATVSTVSFWSYRACSSLCFVFLCLQTCPCKTHCVGSRDERQLAHAFPTCPHCSLSVPVLFGTGRLARQDIRSPLRRRGPRQTVLRGAGAARRLQAAHYDRETDAGCGVVCFCWKAIVSPVCGRQGCCGAVSNGHCWRGLWCRSMEFLGPPPGRWTFWPRALWEASFGEAGLRRGRPSVCLLCAYAAPLREWMMSPIPAVQSALLMSPGELWRQKSKCSLSCPVAKLPLWSPPRIKIHCKLYLSFQSSRQWLTLKGTDPLMGR